MKVFTIDPGRFDPLTAYAAVNTLRLDDMNPHIYRTHDGGKTWKEIVTAFPAARRSASCAKIRSEGAAVRRIGNAGLRLVRRRRSLAVAAAEHGAVVGARSVVKDDDLVVGTHGRGIWILDDITPLRQIDATTAARSERRAVQAADALRVRGT
jgi:hypothetical protein